MVRTFPFTALLCVALLGGCGSRDEGALDLAFVATPDSLFDDGLRLSEAAQHMRAATSLGLVTRDAQGEIIPGLADRWIVTEDGRSFIFRLRDGAWPDGSPLTAQSARQALLAAMKALEGTSMELDLEPIEDVRAMAGRVVELRLSGPFPTLLQLLAQPELALDPAAGAGDMTLDVQGATGTLALKSPATRGLPEEENWRDNVRELHVAALSAPKALELFERSGVDAVLGGRIDSLPLVDTGPLSRGTVRIDPTIGLFGIVILRPNGPLALQPLREAIAMAIDRPAVIASFGIGGWATTTRIVNPDLGDDPGFIAERWTGQTLDDLRTEARRRLATWRARQTNAGDDTPITLTLVIGPGPGYDIIYRELSAQLSQVGVGLERVDEGEPADMALVDRVARYAAPRWFLNQFRCKIRPALCSEDVDYLIEIAVEEPDPTTRATLMAEAEAELTMSNIYIPIATPLRWSLIRGDVGGFVPNRWAFHPLPPMAQITR